MKAARDYPILTVTAKGTRWLESGHPWVYDSDVAREPDESECENGALVDVVSEKGKYLGTGFLICFWMKNRYMLLMWQMVFIT